MYIYIYIYHILYSAYIIHYIYCCIAYILYIYVQKKTKHQVRFVFPIYNIQLSVVVYQELATYLKKTYSSLPATINCHSSLAKGGILFVLVFQGLVYIVSSAVN